MENWDYCASASSQQQELRLCPACLASLESQILRWSSLLRAIPTADQVKMLESGSLDIGFLRLPIGEHSALDVVHSASRTVRTGGTRIHKTGKKEKGAPNRSIG